MMDQGSRFRLLRGIWILVSPTALCSLISLLLYLAYRIKCIVSAYQNFAEDRTVVAQSDRRQSLAFAWLFLVFEVLAFLPSILSYLPRTLAIRRPKYPIPALTGSDVPAVDVLITCCNEDRAVIRNTILAACTIDYPCSRFRIFVCDDGAADDVREMVQELRISYPNLLYTSRANDARPYHKAGSLNHGLRYSRSTLGTIVSEHIAVLDADTIPEPQWLRAVIAPLVKDPRVALACPPQTFYNIPVNDPLTQTMSHLAGIAGVVDSSLGNADCQGPGYAIRRSAIEGIGGFPEESLAEDTCCSTSLLGAGWRTVFVHEILQYGEVPHSFRVHIQQRTRRFVGQVQIALLFKGRLSRPRGRHFTFLQRFAGLTFDVRQFVQVLLALNFVFIPFALWSGYPMVIWTVDDELRWIVRLVTIWSACHWLHQGLMGLVAGLANGRFEPRITSYGAELEQWMAPYVLWAFIQSFLLSHFLGGKTASFTPSRSTYLELKEREPARQRVRNALLNHLLFVHLLFVVTTILGVALVIIRALYDDTLPTLFPVQDLHSTSSKIVYLVARVGWPPLMWTKYLTSCMSPLLYIVFQPQRAGRETLTDRGPEAGAARPSQRARAVPTDGWVLWRYVRICVVIPYVGTLFILSFLL
ncbi:glycosyltransferase family 2 protein [Pseudocercospora fijiensis CIRAD86]|uniref:Glycosyltransferase family 2 protein n=1 Tax=Pseudocercospora fijiensis (strain CIRAD86) TaxID=383855 RepID=M3AMS0_PSEFD|nr:glycosyltransferase family 2 protein [Pseudocercospora fijiensis CIRAD86]EME78423.1 glycosyltransferase family 2 protein [Pseudocercospora fijiensis CIRAD86]